MRSERCNTTVRSHTKRIQLKRSAAGESPDIWKRGWWVTFVSSSLVHKKLRGQAAMFIWKSFGCLRSFTIFWQFVITTVHELALCCSLLHHIWGHLCLLLQRLWFCLWYWNSGVEYKNTVEEMYSFFIWNAEFYS